jgi:hypothetical protein
MRWLAGIWVFGFLAVALLNAQHEAEGPKGRIAAKPLYRDPIYDGAADPVLVWNPDEKKWLMF